MRLATLSLLLGLRALQPSLSRAQCHEPGIERWSIKSSVAAPADRDPRVVPLAQLLALPDLPDVRKNDRRFQNSRIPDTANADGLKEGDIVSTMGYLHLVATEGNDCEYHIQISASPTDGDQCLIVEVPRDDATSIADPNVRVAASAVRQLVRGKLLRGREPGPSGNVMMHPVHVRVTGQLFYDDSHVGDQPRGKRGMKAATLWEIHPITALEMVRP